MDVKYHADQWKKVESSIKELTQSGMLQSGHGIFSSLEDISENMEKAQDKIAKYDSDGVISFSHTNNKSKYRALNEDYAVLQEYGKKVGDLIEEKMDQPFYEDMDEFVMTMRDATISNYTTTNRIGAKDSREYKDETGTHTFELDKKEVNINDLFNSDTHYMKKMMQEYVTWKEQSGTDISYNDYRDGKTNSGAFQYKSIEDGQMSTEFWVNLGIAGTAGVATLIFPPSGVALVTGIGMGTLEATSAVTGKDWLTQRELDGPERWMRGGLSALGAIPMRTGASAVRSFGSSMSTPSVKDIATLSKTSGKNLSDIMGNQAIMSNEAGQLTKQTDTVLRNNTVDNVISLMDHKEAKYLKQSQDAQYSTLDQPLRATGTDGMPTMSKHSGNPGSVTYGSGRIESGGVEVRAPGSFGVVGKGIDNAKDITKLTVDDIPTAKSGNFNKFFNSLTSSELDELWKDKKIRKKIERQLREPGGLHEWHLVSRAPQFKYWNIGAEEIKDLRTAISDVKFVNPNGVHGGLGSTKAHNELLAIIDTSSDYNTFVRRLNNWANYRLEGGVSSLPQGLRLK
ncbi:hypothetical protein SAMN05421663_102189 [Terribacillus halophilus]|uniref:Uncharacterized protein n=1 Tax=Terribacillus halophilus TaxID=361279 RepID=A0A1G6KYW9_9BACI|nr:hypothetical protein [Terribacillus halophilus]SDC36127.1 hypothetical protein SAMN05421663_102189 [Terribacillus halophilus]